MPLEINNFSIPGIVYIVTMTTKNGKQMAGKMYVHALSKLLQSELH